MQKTITSDDLTAYLYAEASVPTCLAIKKALRTDAILARKLDALRKAKNDIVAVNFTAPKHSIQHILDYSRSNALEEHF